MRELLSPKPRGTHTPILSTYLPLYLVQSVECGNTLLLKVGSALLAVRSIILSDFWRLQHQCASCKLLKSLGCPPFAIGTMWSMTGDKGCGYFKDLSTGLPHIPQTSCVASILFLLRSNCRRCTPFWSALFPMIHHSFFLILIPTH